MGRALALVAGGLMVVLGLVWTLQGLGHLGDSPMTDQGIWAIIGPLLAGFGVALVIVAARGPRG